ncbi:MAG TPA: FAD-dependent oxidoreductase [Sphingobium sp.]|nr:FAD-dependent oxidoreductase [Sphingobium sp.]
MKRIVIVGAGFAGTWSALSAARLLDQHGIGLEEIEVTVIAPRASLDLRPRFYEPNVAAMTSPLGPLFDAVDVTFVAGSVEAIDPTARVAHFVDQEGYHGTLVYDRLILAAGSRLVRPDVPGLAQHAFSIDQLDEAAQFEAHLHSLAARPNSVARNMIVVVGGGFTGIEIAAELPARLRAIFGEDIQARVVIIEQADMIGPDLGTNPRPIIIEALQSQGVEWRLGTSVAEIDAGGIRTTDGERIESQSVLWTGGMEASALTRLLPGERDQLGRLRVDRTLRLPEAPEIFVAGDTAYATTDGDGHHAMMSCQHALRLGRFAGHNATADLIGVDPLPYIQERYGTCLDLGPWGSVVTAGWEREVQIAGPAAKEHKKFINSVAIAPPPPIREQALAAANPMTGQ